MDFFRVFKIDLAIDLGTANTLIMHKSKIVVDQPSIIAIDRLTDKTISIGKEALHMHEKTHDRIKTIKPLKDGVIANFHAAEEMIKGMIRMVSVSNGFFPLSYRIMICIPSGITEVEKRAVKDSTEQSGAKEVYMIHEPMAAAIGIGLDIEKPVGCMIVDIGGGTTEIAVIALSGIVCDQSIRVGGDVFNSDILSYVRRKYNLLIGERTSEMIKIEVGSCIYDLEEPPPDYEIRGRDLMTGIPKVINIYL